jgi:hypothetical protein
MNARREATASATATEAQPSRSQQEKHVVFRFDCCLAVVSRWSCATSDQMATSGTRMGQAYFVGGVMIGCCSSIVEVPIMYESEDAG